MKNYQAVEVSEKQLEELVRKHPDCIEKELRYIDHQKVTDRGPLDVLFADSGNALVVAELKVVEDDGMLFQGMDYYDYIATRIDAFANAYKDRKIDPNQDLRLFLIAPSFSIALLNRCKWIDIPITLLEYSCIKMDNKTDEIIPIFKERTIPDTPDKVAVYTLTEKLNYITDTNIRKIAENFIKEIKEWDKDNTLIEAIKYDISIKVFGKVLAYLGPRRKHFMVYTYDPNEEWKGFPVKTDNDLNQARLLVKMNYEDYKE